MLVFNKFEEPLNIWIISKIFITLSGVSGSDDDFPYIYLKYFKY